MKVPFEVPDSWVWCKLGDLFNHNTGKALNASDKEGRLLEYITTSNLYWDRFELSSVKQMYFKNSDIEKCTVTKGDLLVCEGGDIGRAAVWSYDYDIRIQNHIHRLRSYLELNSQFYYFIFYLYKSLNLIGGKGIGIQGLSSNELHKMTVPLPPINEQNRIVSEIKRLFTLVDRLEFDKNDLQNIVNQAKEKILNLAICGKLVPQDPNDESASEQLKRINPKAEITCDNPQYKNLFYKLPKNWSWATLGSISNYGFCKNVDIANIEANDWVLELEDIEKDSGKLLRINRKKDRILNGVRHQFPKGCILYSKLRTYLNKVLIPYEDGYCTTEIIPINCSDGILSSYICHVLRSMYFINYTTLQEYGVKMPRLSTDDARKAFIPIPPTKEQIRIVDKINSLYFVLDNIMAEL